MRLQEIIGGLEKISESFNTIINANWVKTADGFIGSFEINGEIYYLHVDVDDIVGHKCAHISFTRTTAGGVTSKLTADTGMGSVLVMSAISQAFKPNIDANQYDVVYFIANDEIDKRMKVYNKIFQFLSGGYGSYVTGIPLGDSEASVMFKHCFQDKDVFIQAMQVLLTGK